MVRGAVWSWGVHAPLNHLLHLLSQEVAGAVASPANVGASATPFTLFTVDQWKALADFLSNTKISDDRLHNMFTTTDWIVDIGASNHMTGDASLLFDIVCIVDCPVGIPNDAVIMVQKEGLVHLSNTLILTHVLFVPNLHCNLPSVSQLTATMNCIVQFNSKVYACNNPSNPG